MKRHHWRQNLCSALILMGGLCLTLPATGADLNWQGAIGIGYDSNAFRSPDRPYQDLAQSGAPLITPVVQSGTFIPVEFHATLKTSRPSSTLETFYDLKGRFFVDSSLEPANEYHNVLGITAEHRAGKTRRPRRRLSATLFVSDLQRTYVDRDTGEEKISSTSATDISNRYRYQSTGLKSTLRQRLGRRITVTVSGLFEKRDYDDPRVVSEYDHQYLRLGGRLDYRINRRHLIGVRYDRWRRDYSDRHSRDLQGALLNTNPLLRYDYHAAEIRWQSSLRRRWRATINTAWTRRMDNFLGYNDFDKFQVRLQLRHALPQRRQLDTAVKWWRRDYPNAFAFNTPVAEKRTADAVEFSVKFTRRLTGATNVFGRWRSIRYHTNDLRYQYERHTLSAGLNW